MPLDASKVVVQIQKTYRQLINTNKSIQYSIFLHYNTWIYRFHSFNRFICFHNDEQNQDFFQDLVSIHLNMYLYAFLCLYNVSITLFSFAIIQ